MKPNATPRMGQPGSELREIERTAAAWVVQQQQPLTRAEQADLEQWLRRDPRHAEVYAEMHETSFLLDRLHAGASAEIPTVTHRSFWSAGGKSWRAPALVALAAAAIMMIWAWRPPSAATPAAFVQTVTAEKGSLRKLDLPDGSLVHLNAESAVEVSYQPEERQVRLIRGEAHFTVAHDAARPFTVTAGGVAVRAVGTAFDVRMRPGTVEILVTHGRVQVTDAVHGGTLLAPADEPPLLHAGQCLQIPLERPVRHPVGLPAIRIDAQELQRRLAWKEQRLEFSGASLADVVAEFNRHNEHQLRIADVSLAQLRIGGTFTPHGYEAFIELLEQSFGVNAERQEHETILRRKR